MSKPAVWLTLAVLATSGCDLLPMTPEWAEEPGTFAILSHNGGVDSVAFSPDGKTLAVAAFDVDVVLWDLALKKKAGKLHDCMEAMWVGFSPDGKTIATGTYDHRGKLWDAVSKKERALLRHNGNMTSGAFSSDGKILVTTSLSAMPGQVNLWDVETGNHLVTFKGESDGIHHSLALSPDGKTVATCGERDGKIILWDFSRAEQRQTLAADQALVWSVAFSPNGAQLAASGESGTVIIWNASTWKEMVRLSPEVPSRARCLSFSPDSKMLVAGNKNGSLTIWNCDDWRILVERKYKYEISSIAVSPDGKLLAVGTGASVHLLQMEDLCGQNKETARNTTGANRQ